MSILKYPAAFLLLGSSFAFATSPTYQYAISAGSVGIGKTLSIYVTGNTTNGFQTAGGGGEFLGTLTGTTNNVGFWCVDDQEAFNGGGQSGFANVTLVGNVDSFVDQLGTQTHYGTVTNSTSPKWTNSGADPGYSSSLANANTALDRYTLAAYLISQYVGFDGEIDGSTTANVNKNNAIQKAIWAITNTSGPYGANIYEAGFSDLTLNTAGANGPAQDSVAYWVDQALTYAAGSVNPTGWAVVSWGANPTTGALNTGGWNDGLNSSNQTFLVELTGTPPLLTVAQPEPGFYGVLTVGLAGLFFAVRRRRQA